MEVEYSAMTVPFRNACKIVRMQHVWCPDQGRQPHPRNNPRDQ